MSCCDEAELEELRLEVAEWKKVTGCASPEDCGAQLQQLFDRTQMLIDNLTDLADELSELKGKQ